MFKNYLKIALRNFVTHKLYTSINIIGLAIGIACCMLIFLFVRNELSYGRFHPNVENIYQVYVIEAPPGRDSFTYSETPGPMANAMETSFTDIHLNPDIPGAFEPTSDPVFSSILIGIAVLVLSIACTNFMTLALSFDLTSATVFSGLMLLVGMNAGFRLSSRHRRGQIFPCCGLSHCCRPGNGELPGHPCSAGESGRGN